MRDTDLTACAPCDALCVLLIELTNVLELPSSVGGLGSLSDLWRSQGGEVKQGEANRAQRYRLPAYMSVPTC